MKKITITFYNPKELWQRFWIWAFWPRRKSCAEWMESTKYLLESRIVTDLLIEKYYNRKILSDTVVDMLDVDIKAIIERTCEEMKEVMRQPLYEDVYE